MRGLRTFAFLKGKGGRHYREWQGDTKGYTADPRRFSRPSQGVVDGPKDYGKIENPIFGHSGSSAWREWEREGS